MPFWDRKSPAPADLEAIDRFIAEIAHDSISLAAGSWGETETRKLLGVEDPTFSAFMSRYAGSSFGGGLLRFQPIDGDLGLIAWNRPGGWRDDWPSMPRAVAFASDWRGDLFVLDPDRLPSGQRQVAWLRIATGEYEKLDVSFGELIGSMLPKMWRELLENWMFTTWLESGGAVPTSEQCVGHKVPIVLGGSDDDVANLEVLFLRVWVSFSGQIYEQVKNLPPGTKITGINAGA